MELRTTYNRRRRARDPEFVAFHRWLSNYVEEQLDSDQHVDPDVVMLAHPPLARVEEYPAMWAYGNHFRSEPAEGETHAYFDAGVAVVSITPYRARASDRNVVEAKLKWVGVLKHIFVVQYAAHKRTIMRCAWVRPNLMGQARTMKRDLHGFWTVKYDARLGRGQEDYVFPNTVSQVG
jgi:hypothetical protein